MVEWKLFKDIWLLVIFWPRIKVESNFFLSGLKPLLDFRSNWRFVLILLATKQFTSHSAIIHKAKAIAAKYVDEKTAVVHLMRKCSWLLENVEQIFSDFANSINVWWCHYYDISCEPLYNTPLKMIKHKSNYFNLLLLSLSLSSSISWLLLLLLLLLLATNWSTLNCCLSKLKINN